MGLLSVLLPSKAHVSTPFGQTYGLGDSQKHRSAVPAYPHPTQKFLIISWWRDAFSRSYCGRRSSPYSVINPFTNLFDRTRLGIRDEEERTRYWSLWMSHRKRTYYAATKSTMVFPVRYRMEGSPKMPSTSQLAIKG